MEYKTLDARSCGYLVHTWDIAGRVGRKEKKHDGRDSLEEDAASRAGGTLGASPDRIIHGGESPCSHWYILLDAESTLWERECEGWRGQSSLSRCLQ